MPSRLLNGKERDRLTFLCVRKGQRWNYCVVRFLSRSIHNKSLRCFLFVESWISILYHLVKYCIYCHGSYLKYHSTINTLRFILVCGILTDTVKSVCAVYVRETACSYWVLVRFLLFMAKCSIYRHLAFMVWIVLISMRCFSFVLLKRVTWFCYCWEHFVCKCVLATRWGTLTRSSTRNGCTNKHILKYWVQRLTCRLLKTILIISSRRES